MVATVEKVGDISDAVEWSVDSASATDGFTISNEGLLEAPATASVESVTVTATSVADNTKSDSITLEVETPHIVSVGVSMPEGVTDIRRSNKPIQMVATVEKVGDISEAVTWSTDNDVYCSIDATGKLYIGDQGFYELGDSGINVTATSTADNTKSGTVNVPVYGVWKVVVTDQENVYTYSDTGTPDTFNMVAEVYKGGTIPNTVTWSISSSTGNVSIDSNTGVLTVGTTDPSNKPSTFTVRAQSADGVNGTKTFSKS